MLTPFLGNFLKISNVILSFFWSFTLHCIISLKYSQFADFFGRLGGFLYIIKTNAKKMVCERLAEDENDSSN